MVLDEIPFKNWLIELFLNTVLKNYIWGQFHQHSTSSFTRADPKSTKRLDELTVFFALLGSVSAKAVHRMLVKLTPGLNFINILCRAQKRKMILMT